MTNESKDSKQVQADTGAVALTDSQIDAVHDEAAEDLAASYGLHVQDARLDTRKQPTWRRAFARAILAAHLSPAAESDKALLDTLQNESWDLRSFCIGEEDVGWRVVEFHMAAPHERVIAEVFKDDPRAAIRAAMSREQSGGKAK